jgi:hypothetical protein
MGRDSLGRVIEYKLGDEPQLGIGVEGEKLSRLLQRVSAEGKPIGRGEPRLVEFVGKGRPISVEGWREMSLVVRKEERGEGESEGDGDGEGEGKAFL